MLCPLPTISIHIEIMCMNINMHISTDTHTINHGSIVSRGEIKRLRPADDSKECSSEEIFLLFGERGSGFQERVCLWSPGCPKTFSVIQDTRLNSNPQKSAYQFLQSAWIKGVCHHHVERKNTKHMMIEQIVPNEFVG